MEIMTSELLDLARERGSAFVAVATPGELFEYDWDSTDARWEEILHYAGVVVENNQVLYVGVVTEGVTIDNQTYEMREHLTMTVVHPAGYESWKVPLTPFNALVDTDPVVSLGEQPVEELEFDLKALQEILPWS
jgi:hypothetical protein